MATYMVPSVTRCVSITSRFNQPPDDAAEWPTLLHAVLARGLAFTST